MEYIAKKLESGRESRLNFYEVIDLLAHDYINHDYMQDFVDKVRSNPLDEIREFAVILRNQFGDATIEHKDLSPEFEYQFQRVMELASRLGTTAEDILAVYNIDYKGVYKERARLGAVKTEKYPYIDEMRQAVRDIVSSEVQTNPNMDTTEKQRMYLDACSKAFNMYRAKIEEAEFNVLDVGMKKPEDVDEGS